MNEREAGIFSDIPNSEYHGGPGVSKSGLDLIARSPLHYWHARNVSNDNQPTVAQRLGTLAHDLILEPEEFWNRYAIPLDPRDFPDAIHSRDELVTMVDVLNADRLPKLSASGTKEELIERIQQDAPETGCELAFDLSARMGLGDLKRIIAELNEFRPGLLSTRGSMKELAHILADHGQPVELWSDLVAMDLATNDGKTIISADEHAQACGMRDAVMAHPAARGLLTTVPGRAELSAYWRDAETGVLCRCRPDFWRADGILVDLKTTDDASPEEFGRSVLKWRYHVQAAMYLDGTRAAAEQGGGLELIADPEQGEGFAAIPEHFLFIVVEKKPPHAVAVYKLDAMSLQHGLAEYRRDLARYAECLAADRWPAFGDTVQQTGLPEWFLRREFGSFSA
jgi:exodeoxyribonuclease VIII